MWCRLTLFGLLGLAGCAGSSFSLPSAPAAPAQRAPLAGAHAITEFQIHDLGESAAPYAIAAGRDGAMWFTEAGSSAIGRIDRYGSVRQFALPAAGSQPEGIALGDDGALYFAENAGSAYGTHLGRISGQGRVQEWNDSNYAPKGVAAGPHGTVWFTQGCAGLAVLHGGKAAQLPLDGISGQTLAIARGPDGAMWFAEDGTARIGRMTGAGTLTLYTGFMYQHKYGDVPNGVAIGPDGNLWWTAMLGDKIWAMDVHGRVRHVYTIPTPNAEPWGIATGRDGALWFTEWGGNKIGRVTTDGRFSEYALPTANAKPQGIARAADGSLWFVEMGANQIGRIME